MQAALAAVPGVKEVKVSHPEKKATVTAEKGKVEKDKLISALKAAGYADSKIQ